MFNAAWGSDRLQILLCNNGWSGILTRDCTLHLINDVVKVVLTIVITGRTVQLLEAMLPPEITTLGVCNVLIEQQQSSNVPSHFLFPRTLSHITSTGSAVIQVVNTGPSYLV